MSNEYMQNGIAHRLLEMVDDLEAVSEESDEIKDELYEIVYDTLELTIEQIKKLVSNITDIEASENIREMFEDTDDLFVDSFESLLDAVDYIEEYLETEDPDLLEKAIAATNEGMFKMNTADQAAQDIDSMPMIDGVEA